MSIVSNFAGGISPTQFGNINTVTNGINIDDTTFSDILNKQKSTTQKEQGVPAGMTLEELSWSNNTTPIQEIGSSIDIKAIKDEDLTTSEITTFYSSVMDKNFNDAHNQDEIFDFVKRNATSAYGKFARTPVTDLKEFVTDSLKLKTL